PRFGDSSPGSGILLSQLTVATEPFRKFQGSRLPRKPSTRRAYARSCGESGLSGSRGLDWSPTRKSSTPASGERKHVSRGARPFSLRPVSPSLGGVSDASGTLWSKISATSRRGEGEIH